MVLINTVTVEAINTALIALQRGQSITIGGEKGGTVNNINVTNNGTGSGTDVSPQLNALDKRVTEVEKAEEGLKTENEKQDIRITVLDEKVAGLEGLGIEDIEFEEGSRTLFIYLVNGDVLDVVIPDSPLSLSLNGTTLTLSSDGETLSNVELPFIPSSEKGVAGGVATLDSSGRIPYSQLPESAMEFLGQWDASTNTPHLADGTGTNGDFYIVSTGGTVNFGTVAEPRNITFYPNDRVVYEGDISKWFRLPAGSVSSVNGMSGDVVLNGTNVNYSDAADSPTLKDKIDSVETKADIQADWNTSCTTSLSYIKNKPTIPPSPVQSDWNVTDTTSLAYIKNKPNIPTGNVIKAVCVGAYWGIADPTGADNVWIRTTTQGIIPYQCGGSSAGHQSLGTASWYFADAYVQNVHGTTILANGYQLKRYYELDLRSLSSSNFYPITFPSTDLELDCEIHSPNGSASMAYNQNYIHFKLIAQGWSDTPKRLVIEQYAVYDAGEITIGSIGMGNRAGGNCVWVRGGMIYRFYSNQTPTLHSTDYTYDSQTFSVGPNKTGGTNANVTIAWEADGLSSARFPNSLYAGLFRGPVADSGNACATTFAYSKAGLASNPSWLAAWNGYELRAVSPSVVCVSCAGFATCACYGAKGHIIGNCDYPIMQTTMTGIEDTYAFEGVDGYKCFTYNPSTKVLKAPYFCGTVCGDICGWSIVQDCCEILIKKGFDNLHFICFNGDAKQCDVYKAICNIVHECYGAIPSTGQSRWETGFIGYVIFDNSNGICNCFHDIGVINLTSSGKVGFYNNADSCEIIACNTCSSRVAGRLTRGFFVL